MDAGAAPSCLRRGGPQDLAQAEAALDTEQAMPVGADVRASRTIRMLGEEYLKDSIGRGKQPRTMEQRESRLNAHILPTIGEVPGARSRTSPIGHRHRRRLLVSASDVTRRLWARWRAGLDPAAVGTLRHD